MARSNRELRQESEAQTGGAHMSDEERPVEAKAWVNVLLIIIGILFIVAGLMHFYPDLVKRALPADIAENIWAEDVIRRVASLTGTAKTSHLLVYGMFAVIGGMGLFRMKAWAWGMAIVILSLIVVTTILEVLLGIVQTGVEELFNPAWWVQAVAGLAAIVALPVLFKARTAYTA